MNISIFVEKLIYKDITEAQNSKLKTQNSKLLTHGSPAGPILFLSSKLFFLYIKNYL